MERGENKRKISKRLFAGHLWVRDVEMELAEVLAVVYNWDLPINIFIDILIANQSKILYR